MKIGTSVYMEKIKENIDFYFENYDCLEIQDFIMPNNLDDRSEIIIDEYKQILKEYSGEISLHGPYVDLNPTSFDPLIKEISIKRYLQIIDIAKIVKAKYIVFHTTLDPRTQYDGYEEFFAKQMIEFWSTIVPLLEENQIVALMENIHNESHGPIKKVIDTIKSPYLGACLDAGHVNAATDTDIGSWVLGYKEALRYIHLHDNDGIRDQHLPIGEGNLNLNEFFSTLKEIEYDGWIIAELLCGIEGQKKNLKEIKKRIK